jgi:hypothetical protein
MIFPSCRQTVRAVLIFLTVIAAIIAPAGALAQAPPGTPTPGAPPGQIAEPPPTQTATRDGFGNWGLLGLLGLVGLARLLRRDRRRSVTADHSLDLEYILPVDHTKLDYSALWLNYENKMDELRNRFLTITSILFAVQIGILALLVDKIILLEKDTLTSFVNDELSTPLPFITGILLIVFSILTARFLYITYTYYTSHILTNEIRSSLVEREYPAITEFKDRQRHNQKVLQSKLEPGEKNYRKKSKLNPEKPQDPLITLKRACIIYVTLCVFTLGMLILGWYFNPDLQNSYRALKAASGRLLGHIAASLLGVHQ